MKKLTISIILSIIILSMMFCSSGDDTTSTDDTTIGQDYSDYPLELVVQQGHSKSVKSVSFSPDGKYIASGSEDTIIKIWDTLSGNEIITFEGHVGSVESVSFSPDGNYLASGSGDSTIKLWDIITGKHLKTLSGHLKNLTSICFSPDGKNILSGSIDGTSKLWDVYTGNEIRTFETFFSSVYSIDFNSEGKYVLIGGRNLFFDSEIRIFDVETGYWVKKFQLEKIGRIKCVCFSPNDKYIVVSGSSSNTPWNDTIILLDIESEKEIWKVTTNQTSIASVNFSPNGKYLASGNDENVILWDLETGKEIKTFEGHTSYVNCVCFSPNGKYIASGSGDTLKLWDVKTGKEILEFKNNSSIVISLNINLEENNLSTGTESGMISFWNLKTIKCYKVLKNNVSPILGISQNWKYVISVGQNGKTMNVCDIDTGEVIHTFDYDSRLLGAIFSQDGEYVIVGNSNYDLKLYETNSGIEIQTFNGHSGSILSICFSSDNKYILSSSLDYTMKLWDVKTGKEIRTFEDFSIPVFSCCFTPDSKYVISGSHKEIKLWDVDSGIEIRTFNGHSGSILSICFSQNEGYFASSSDDGTIKLWDVDSGIEIRTFKGHSDWVLSVCFSQNGEYLISGSMDKTTRLWNIETGESMVMMSSADDWLIYTDDGYWDASDDGGDMVAMVRGMDVWAIDQFSVRNNRPDIILERIGKADPDYIDHLRKQYTKRLRKLGLTEDDLTSELHVPTAEILSAEQDGKFIDLEVKLNDTKYNLKSYNIYVNDVPIFGAYGKDISGKSKVVKHRIELTSGENKIEVSTMNEKASEAFRALTFADYDQPVTGDLYYIGFGVSDYKDDEISDLGYASKDAQDLAQLFNRMEGKGFNKVHTKLYLDEDATIESIKNAKDFLKDAKVDDTFVLFIAGHGLHSQDEEATYYYMLHDTTLDELTTTGADFDFIEEILQGIAPRKKLFLMDTCGSGELDEEMTIDYLEKANGRGITSRGVKKTLKAVKETDTGKDDDDDSSHPSRRRESREYLFEKDRYIYNDMLRRSGAIVFSSCKGSELSYEDDSIANGFFTEGIINTFTKSDADKDNNSIISTDELRSYVLSDVPAMTDDLQHPTVDRDNIYIQFKFPALK